MKNNEIGATDMAHAEATGQMLSYFKMMAVLECFSRSDKALTVLQISKRTELPRTTVHRLVSSLKTLGLLEQDRDRERYRLGLKLFELGNTVLANMDVQREAEESINTLSNKTGLAVHLGVFDGHGIIMVSRKDSKGLNNIITLESAAAHCSATGKAVLAHQSEAVIKRVISEGLPAFTTHTITDPDALRSELRKTLERGYSIDDCEYEDWRRCVGAPIWNASGRIFAAISVTGEKERFTETSIPEFAALIKQQTRLIAQRLGADPDLYD
ncbi:IclR family transcriptional regulator [Rhizobium sp. LC145]|uniref:IclR family transcriptional regulator n=1 Tax=Rhizobium sp. LC145 TaxID=1120688 RepID=UPI00069CB8CF|nr:IclR family transcriptional regulator [Rhizobium sp. LC145]TKT57975.1 IclR family transcriptional regulator [Rhizobiaceae bacterium LC148]